MTLNYLKFLKLNYFCKYCTRFWQVFTSCFVSWYYARLAGRIEQNWSEGAIRLMLGRVLSPTSKLSEQSEQGHS